MDDEARTLEELGEEIATLAAHIHAATCRWLLLVAEFDAREGWAHWGCRSCAHWVSWRCSIAPGPAREHVRVARRLCELPLVRAAYARGQLSYSKVRALTRIEVVEREDDLLELARCSTAAQLERIVQGYRRVTRTDADRASRERYLTVTHDDDGSVVVRGRLPREEGAILLKALEAARDREWRVEPDRGTASQSAHGDAAQRRRNPPTHERGVPRDAGCVSAGTVPALREVRVTASGRSREGSESTHAGRVPAGTVTPTGQRGVSAGEARSTSVDVERGRPSSDPIGSRTQDLGVRNADALVLLAEEALAAGDPHCRSGAERYQVVVHVDVDTLAGVGEAETDGRCELDDQAPLTAETARRLSCDASVVTLASRDGEPLSVGRKTRTVPPALRRALRARDRGCRFPGCTQRRWVDAHHIRHWAQGGQTALSNLVHLCRHHHRLVHEGGYSVERAAGGTLRFRLPDGRAIAPVSTPTASARAAAIVEDNHRRGLRIDGETCVPRWYGERLDLPAAVDAVLTCARQRR